jgi:FkbH-like protein
MPMTLLSLKELLARNDSNFWSGLDASTAEASTFEDLVVLSSLRKKAALRNLNRPGPAEIELRLAILGGCSLYPLHEILTHLLETAGLSCEVFLGDFDNYVAEITDSGSGLYAFGPGILFLLPGPQRCRFTGSPGDLPEAMRLAADAVAAQLLELCRVANERSKAEVILGNFALPSHHDPGQYRSRTLASEWNFRKAVNLELGLKAPPCVKICDVEFLASRLGGLASENPRGWFESKQPCSPSMLVAICREAAHLAVGMRKAPKKVLVLDLDNTLWGGVVAEDGVEGLEIGDTSPRGEAFKAFQRYVFSLKERGVLLAVCSKNDHARAIEPFERHPEMVLHLDDFVAFQANWDPKPDNLLRIAAELNVGIDSLAFVDDSPAEIEIVRQFAPEVGAILLGPDPADYVGQLKDCRMFEVQSITPEDAQRSAQYHAEAERGTLQSSSVDMDAFLVSLAMEAVIREFTAEDSPRLAQLINKSNQFNLTTRRRTETEIAELMRRPDCVCFSMRLGDRFGDNGLISVIIAKVREDGLEIDTWLMSCRVLKRQVEETMLNELLRIAKDRGCVRVIGTYLPTQKNGMVREFYSHMGFNAISCSAERGLYELDVGSFKARSTKIRIVHRPYEST